MGGYGLLALRMYRATKPAPVIFDGTAGGSSDSRIRLFWLVGRGAGVGTGGTWKATVIYHCAHCAHSPVRENCNARAGLLNAERIERAVMIPETWEHVPESLFRRSERAQSPPLRGMFRTFSNHVLDSYILASSNVHTPSEVGTAVGGAAVPGSATKLVGRPSDSNVACVGPSTEGSWLMLMISGWVAMFALV
jgi:hypothetical protein